MNGVPVNQPVTIPWIARSRRATLNFAIGPWPTGVYFVKLTANDGRVGYAPFTVRPTTLGSTSRIAVVIPTNTWQAYNFRDADGNGWGDTWYARAREPSAYRVSPQPPVLISEVVGLPRVRRDHDGDASSRAWSAGQ